jgi:quercetin dioxygenase-like cupin family protein
MTTAESSVVDWEARSKPGPVTGVVAADVQGTQLSAARYVLDAAVVVPEHSHPNEEFGQVIRGALELTVDGVTETLAVGAAFLIPGDVPHSCRAGQDGCELLECYAPPRSPR